MPFKQRPYNTYIMPFLAIHLILNNGMYTKQYTQQLDKLQIGASGDLPLGGYQSHCFCCYNDTVSGLSCTS